MCPSQDEQNTQHDEPLSQASLHVVTLSRPTNLSTACGPGPIAQVWPLLLKPSAGRLPRMLEWVEAVSPPPAESQCVLSSTGAGSVPLGSWPCFVCSALERESQAEGLGQLEGPGFCTLVFI